MARDGSDSAELEACGFRCPDGWACVDHSGNRDGDCAGRQIPDADEQVLFGNDGRQSIPPAGSLLANRFGVQVMPGDLEEWTGICMEDSGEQSAEARVGTPDRPLSPQSTHARFDRRRLQGPYREQAERIRECFTG